MSQPTDITLDGAGYMLVPGTYTRSQDGAAEGRTGRVVLRDFFGGQRRAIQLERDRSFGGVSVGPALDGQGVQPWGARITSSPISTLTNVPTIGQHIPHAFVNDHLYFAIDRQLFASPTSSGGWTSPTVAYTATHPITDICLYGADGLLLAFGPAQDILFIRPAGGPPTALKTGERAHAIAGYAGYACWSDARPSYVRMVTGSGLDTRILDYPITAFANVASELFVITRQSLYSYSGRVKDVSMPNPAYTGPGDTDPPTITGQEWSGEFTPYFQHGVITEPDDFRVFVGYGGRIHAWVSGQMMEDNPRGQRAGWRATGLSGRRCFGGTVAAGYVIVSIESHQGRNELWAWDGSGWWCLASQPMATTGTWLSPKPLAGGGGQRDLLVFRAGERTVDLFRLQHRPTLPAWPAEASFVTPLIDAAERDKPKAWRRIGAVFASPAPLGNTTSTDTVTVSLDFSLDAGGTWVTAISRSLSGNSAANQTFSLDATLTDRAITSPWLMLRVRWESVNDWAPVLTGLWAEFEVLDAPARRRRWNLRVIARDQVIDRQGSPLSRSGRQLIAELWSAWQRGTPLTLRDQDFDADPTPRRVRIVGISESVPKPIDADKWGDAVITLNLVEV